jgi:conflict system STAND superfamily ATPase
LWPVDSATRLDALHPWPGLDSYDEASRDFFHGRDKEAETLERLVKLAPLVVLYGRSGLGKSSLLKAGLFPRLRVAGLLPVYIRIDFSESSPSDPLEQIARHVELEVAEQRLEVPVRGKGEPLWNWLHRKDFEIWTADNQLLVPVIVLDQFEELFSRFGGDPGRIAEVIDGLADLAENRIAARVASDRARLESLDTLTQRYRMLFAFREDFLPDIRRWLVKMPSLLLHELQLEPMTPDRAERAVERAGRSVLAAGVARLIVDFVAGREQSRTLQRTIEPALLSLTCTQLNFRRGSELIDSTLVSASANNILEDFYRDALKDMPERVRRFIEDRLLQGERTRGSYSVDEAIEEGLITLQELEILTTQRRLLRRVESQHDIARVELIHDRLIDAVRFSRQARKNAEAAERENHEERVRADARLAEEREARQRDEREALAIRLELEEAARVRAQADAKKIRKTNLGLACALVAVIGLLVFALKSDQRAHRAQKEADKARIAADKARTYAEEASRKAVQAQEEANKARAVAEEKLKQGAQQILRYGWVGEASAELDGDQVNESSLADESVQTILDTDTRRDLERRKGTTIEIFEKDVDGGKVRSTLADLGFRIYPRPPIVQDEATNAVWFGRFASAADVKLVALALMRVGVQLREIHPIPPNRPGDKVEAPLIQIGTDPDVINLPAWTVKQLLSQQTFARE